MVDYIFNESGFQAYTFYHSKDTLKNESGSLYKFIYVKSGKCILSTAKGELCVEKGQMLFAPIDTPRTVKYLCAPNEDCYGTTIKVRFFAGVNRWDYPPQVIIPDPKTLEMINDIPVDNYGPVSKDCNFMRRFFAFLDTVQGCMVKNTGSYTEIIENAINFMYDNSDYTIGDIARHCNISESYLFRIFEKNVLISPVKMKQRIQINKAEKLLRETNLTIDEIADRVGFSSTAHFRKVFASRFNLSPSEIRKKHKKN